MNKSFFFTLLLSSLVGLFFISANDYRSQSKIVFCNVGQGDAIYIRTPEQKDVLIDAGPYKAVINCLNKHLPFFDRTIELAFITHAQTDHFGGYQYLLNSFKVERLFTARPMSELTVKSTTWQNLLTQLKTINLELEYLERGDQIKLITSQFNILWPAESAGGPTSTMTDLNDLSLGILALVQSKSILLLSDLNVHWAEKAIEQENLNVDILKANHHGSKYGISSKFLKLANPQLVVISAGYNNIYNHPHPDTLSLLRALGINYRRTDQEGDIIIPL